MNDDQNARIAVALAGIEHQLRRIADSMESRESIELPAGAGSFHGYRFSGGWEVTISTDGGAHFEGQEQDPFEALCAAAKAEVSQ